MAEEQEIRRKKMEKKQPDLSELYGLQGNEGQYGLGQYDSEGNPDPHGEQGRQINVDPRLLKPKEEKPDVNKRS